MKLNTDNPDLMPVTDSVYGRPPKRGKPGQSFAPRGHRTAVWRTVPPELLTRLARDYPKLRRLTAQRRGEA